MAEVKWTQSAYIDIDEILTFISKDSYVYALRVIEKIIQRIEQLKTQPLSGKIVSELNDESIRELVSGNYRIIYHRADNSVVTILRIHHSAKEMK